MIVLPSSVFFAIPKTGSQWVTSVLGKLGAERYGPQHGNPGLAVLAEERMKFAWGADPHPLMSVTGKAFYTFVRHPAHWYRSIWAYSYRDNRCVTEPIVGAFGSLDNCSDKSYEQFLRNVIRLNPGYLTRLYSRFCGNGLVLEPMPGIKAYRIEDAVTVLPDLMLEYEGVDKSVTEKIIEEMPPINTSPDLPPIHVELSEHICLLENSIMERFGYRAVKRPDLIPAGIVETGVGVDVETKVM
jgi:hypothetical protein